MQLKFLKTKAYAKVNLLLKVTGKRKSDGYHQLQMIMQTVSLADDLIFKVIQKPEVKIISKNLQIKREENLVYKIADYMLKKFAIKQGLEITIIKNIYLGAGLGGGSSDGAETIKAINKLFALNLSRTQMIDIAKKFGSDIAFFISGGTALVSGVGDRIKLLPDIQKFYAIVIKPNFSLSTKQVYQKVKKYSAPLQIPQGKLSLEKLNGLSLLQNDLTAAAIIVNPDLKKILVTLQNQLSGQVLMTGSGSAIVSYYDDQQARDRDFKILLQNKTDYQVVTVESVTHNKNCLLKFFKIILFVFLGIIFYRLIKSRTKFKFACL